MRLTYIFDGNICMQLLRFKTLFRKISGYYHPLALSNAVSKLTSFPNPASHVPHLDIYASASDSSSLEFVRYINSVIIIIIIIIIINSINFGKCDNSNSGTHFGKHTSLIFIIVDIVL